MIVIRLKRFGKKKQPFYRIVIAPKTAPVKGRYIEALGFYNPLKKNDNIQIKKERIKFWIEKGAQISNTVNNLLVQAEFFPKSQNIKKTVMKKKEKKKEEKKEKPKEIIVPKAQQKQEEGGLLEQAEEEIEKEIKDGKESETKKAEIAEKLEEAKEEKSEEKSD